MKLISFDIDGTLTFGSPPGAISVERILQEKALGHLVGSASDRTVTDQRELWKKWGLEPDFIVLKHRLEDLRLQFQAGEYLHVGDGEMDRFFAERAGFGFQLPADYMRQDGYPGGPLP